MTNNDVLRRVRYIFDFSDDKMIAIFALADCQVTRAEVSDWLKQEDDDAYVNCPDARLASFLNGLIIDKRGKQDGPPPKPEKKLDNNIVFRKLKIALNLQTDDILIILALSNLEASKHELGAFFRKPENKHFRKCKDQVLRHFLMGLQIKFRDSLESTTSDETKVI